MVDGELITLPEAEHVEKVILGAMMVEPSTIADVTPRLDAEDFQFSSHKTVYRAILALVAKGSAVDYITVSGELDARRSLDAAGGRDYLAELSERLPRHLVIDSYIRIVKEKSLLRQLMAIGHDASIAASDQSEDAQSLIAKYRGLLDELGQSDDALDIPSVGQWLASQRKADGDDGLKDMAAADGIRLGFAQWDALTMGAGPGELHIVAARPAMGKTAWMCSAASSCALRGRVVAVFSLEQKRKAIIRRMLSAMARVPLRDIQSGEIRADDRRLLQEHRARLAESPLYVDDTPGLTASRIRAKCARLKRMVGLDVVMVDQLSHVSMADCRERDFRLKIGEQTRSFKRLGQEFGVPVILFNQLRRPDGKGDTVPRLSDLKESGNIEEDADVVTLLHRPEYYAKDDHELKGKAQMIVAKNREGETGTIHCRYDGSIVRWDDEPAQEGFSYADR